jgi:hypothetical protein
MRLHDRRQSVKLTADRFQRPTVGSGGVVSEFDYSRQDRCDHLVILDEFGHDAREVGACPPQLGEHPHILALVMRRQRGAEGQAMGDKHVVGSVSSQAGLELVDSAPQFLMRLRELQAERDCTVAVVGSH